jgi:3-hydroxyacyl-[acyl-carrier-protein] dehydratase
VSPNRAEPERLDDIAVQRLLAHRYPLLLVDRMEIVEAGVRVVGYKRVTGGEWFALGARSAEYGAWSGAPSLAMPPLLIVEALAQTSGALMLGLLDQVGEGALAYFMGFDAVRFRAPALPGAELRMEVSLSQFRRGICRTRGVARLDDGTLAVSARLTTVLRPAR